MPYSSLRSSPAIKIKLRISIKYFYYHSSNTNISLPIFNPNSKYLLLRLQYTDSDFLDFSREFFHRITQLVPSFVPFYHWTLLVLSLFPLTLFAQHHHQLRPTLNIPVILSNSFAILTLAALIHFALSPDSPTWIPRLRLAYSLAVSVVSISNARLSAYAILSFPH